MLDSLWSTLEATSLAGAIRGDGGWAWLFPIVETCHVACLALVFGSVMLMDLRLIGLTARNYAVSHVVEDTVPWALGAFVLAAVTGSLMFISKAHEYAHNPAFELKVLCLLLIGANMLLFHRGAYRRVAQWELARPTPWASRTAGVISLTLWVSVVFLGRWVGWGS